MVKALFYLILAAGAGNTVLRPEIENPLTLYRILAPLGLLVVFYLRPLLVTRFIGAFVLFVIYNVVLATLYSGNYSELFPSLVHYFYLGILLVLMIYMKNRKQNFDGSFLYFVKFFYLFLLLNLVFEIFIGSYYPNLYVDDSDDGSIRAFYWNQNDLAVVICIIAWICLAYDKYNQPTKITVVFITLIILFINDSKAALISFCIVTLPVFYLLRTNRKRIKIPKSAWYFVGMCFFIPITITFLEMRTTEIQFANQSYTLEELLIKPVIGILTLQASGEEWGSINNRMDASIFVIIEYLRSYGLGLGAGGTWLVLTLPQYQLAGAQSPHNALLQFLADFGFPILFGYLYLFIWAIRRFDIAKIDEKTRLQVIAIFSFPLLGLSQSGAIVTNYFFWSVIYFIWLQGRNRITHKQQ